MTIHLTAVLISTRPARRSLDSRTYAWIRERPTDAILAVFAVMMGLYLMIYLGSGAWAMETDYSPAIGGIHHG